MKRLCLPANCPVQDRPARHPLAHLKFQSIERQESDRAPVKEPTTWRSSGLGREPSVCRKERLEKRSGTLATLTVWWRPCKMGQAPQSNPWGTARHVGALNTPKAMRERKGHRKIICGGPDSSISMVVIPQGSRTASFRRSDRLLRHCPSRSKASRQPQSQGLRPCRAHTPLLR